MKLLWQSVQMLDSLKVRVRLGHRLTTCSRNSRLTELLSVSRNAASMVRLAVSSGTSSAPAGEKYSARKSRSWVLFWRGFVSWAKPCWTSASGTFVGLASCLCVNYGEKINKRRPRIALTYPQTSWSLQTVWPTEFLAASGRSKRWASRKGR